MGSRGPRNYRDLIAWQAAVQLASDAEVVCKRLPRRRWKLIEQLRESERSVHANIAEGNGRATTPDYLRFLSMSKGSLQELQGDLIDLRRASPQDKPIKTALDRTYIVEKLLLRLIEALERKRDQDDEAT